MSVYELPKLWTEDELAQNLGVHPETLARERRRGRLPYTRIGTKIRYTAAHVDQYLKAQECGSTSSSAAPKASGKSAGQTLLAPRDAHRLALQIATKPNSR